MTNKNFDYNQFSITVNSQKEFDLIPSDYNGRVYIKNTVKRIVLNGRYAFSVEARGNSSVEAWGNSSVVAWGNSSVVARENSSVVARENSSVVAWENSSVEAMGNSSVEAWGNSSVVAWENSSVEAWGNSSVVAWGNCQIVDRQLNGNIKVSGNARVVYFPKTVFEFLDFYGIFHTKTKAVLYKAVKKINNKYLSYYDQAFEYQIGKDVSIACDKDVLNDCSFGLHISHLNWALNFGRDCEDLAILEVETKIKDIVLPKNSDGKVRTSSLKVLREVPLEDCGIFGKILAKRRKENETN